MLQRHGDHVHTDDEGDEEVQVVISAQVVDHQADVTVAGVIRQLLGFWNPNKSRQIKSIDQSKMKGE